MAKNTKQVNRQLRKARVRSKIRGTAQRPRVSVSSSLTGIFAQMIDDVAGKTLIAARDKGIKGTKTERAAELGSLIAKEAKKAGISSVVFDRAGKKYHGRVQAFADALRAGGIKL